MVKRILGFFVICCIMLGTLYCPAFAGDKVMFGNSEVEAQSEMLRKLGLFDLYGDDVFFGENESVKRHEAAKALVDLFGLADGASLNASNIFYDVPAYYEHAGCIGSAVANGLMVGVGNGLFKPENDIEAMHFLKALVSALGYGWKAEMTGYPGGYLSVAGELKLLDGVSLSTDSPLTRAALVQILFNSLDVPVCIQNGYGADYTDYTIDEDVTLLTYYHDIYTDDGIVMSDTVVSLAEGYEPDKQSVMIGTDKLVAWENHDIFGFLGCEVEYYYREESGSNKKILVYFEITESESAFTLHSADIVKAGVDEIIALDEKEREVTYKIESGADVIYNGKRVAENIAQYLDGVNGTVRLVNTDGSAGYDTVVISDYVYDEVLLVDAENGLIYTENGNINTEDAEYLKLCNSNGDSCTINDIGDGDVVAVAKSIDEKCLTVMLMKNRYSFAVTEKSDEGIGSGDEFYHYGKNLLQSMKELAAIGNTVTLVTDAGGEIVWIIKGASTSVTGYLIKLENTKEVIKDQIYRAVILGTNGDVCRYHLADSVKIDNKSVEAIDVSSYLENIKTNLGLMSDGSVSQVITYKVNDNNVLTEIGTASPNGGALIKKFSGVELSVQNQGNSSAVIDDRYPVTMTVPVFRVPLTDQESYDDNYFNVTGYSADGGFSGGDKLTIEGYISEEDEVLCTAMVLYEEAAADIPKQAKLFLVEKASVFIDANNEECGKVCGYWGSGYDEVLLDESLELPDNLTAGDVCVFNTNTSGRASMVDVVYDYETDTVLPPYNTYERIRDIKMTHVYNAPEGSAFVESYINTDGFAELKPPVENMVVLNFVALPDKAVVTFDREQEKIIQGRPSVMLDYRKNSKDYTKVLVRYSYGYPNDYIIYR